MSLEDKSVFMSADWDFLKDKGAKANILCYMADNSIYYNNQRILNKKQMNFSQLSKNEYFGTRKTISKSVDKMIENYPHMIQKLDNGDYLLNLDKGNGFTISLPHKTIKHMYLSLPNVAIKLYLFLYRQHLYWTNQKKTKYNFTLKNLVEGVGYFDNYENREMIKTYLKDLTIHGLISYSVVRKKKCYYRQLNYVKKYFVAAEKIDIIENYVADSLTENVLEDSGEEEILFTFGDDVEDKLFIKSENRYCTFEEVYKLMDKITGYREENYQNWVSEQILSDDRNINMIEKYDIDINWVPSEPI